jgi:FAD dependent oxidoreductase/S-layer homology domain
MTQAGILDDDVFLRPRNDDRLHVPILVVGGSTAAYAAALGALQSGIQVCLVQPQLVLGGQYTAQALSASDDAPLMTPKELIPSARQDPRQLDNGELFSISKLQRQFRDRQRALQPVEGKVLYNPGGGWVSHFAVTPVTSAIAFNQGIEPYLKTEQLTLIPLAEPVQVLLQDLPGEYRRVQGIVFQDRQTDAQFTITGDVVIEATDLGDLLELGNIESRVGQESRSETGEAALPEEPRPMCQQAFTFCALVERAIPEQASSIDAPNGYGTEPWLNPAEFTGTFWVQSEGQWQGRAFFEPYGIFRYRRLLRSVEDSQAPQCRVGDVSVMNWGTSPVEPDAPDTVSLGCGNDYRFGALTGVSRAERERHIRQGRERAQGYLYFLQTHDAPDLTPRGDLTWTTDGIALEPYIREARRGIALTTIRHEDVSTRFFPNSARAHSFNDSVGIGQYHYLDFHPSLAPGHVELGAEGNRSLPFTIPLGALIPLRTDGLVLSAKSIGTTHITNSAYRMHPIEWAIGEAGGHLAAFALSEGVTLRDVAKETRLLRKFQGRLARQGIPLYWFNDVSHDDPDFEAIQVLAAAAIVRTEEAATLNFKPEGVVSRGEVAMAIANILSLELKTPPHPSFTDVSPNHIAYRSIEALFKKGIIVGVGNRRFAPERKATRQHLATMLSKAGANLDTPFAETPINSHDLHRRELSRVLYKLLQTKLGFESKDL